MNDKVRKQFFPTDSIRSKSVRNDFSEKVFAKIINMYKKDSFWNDKGRTRFFPTDWIRSESIWNDFSEKVFVNIKMIHISIQSLSVVRFNIMYGIENESSSGAKQKISQNIQTMSILTPYHLVKIFRLWVFLRPVSWQQQIYWEHVAVAVNSINGLDSNSCQRTQRESHFRKRLREFRGLAPKSVFGGLAPRNHLTMVIILPPSLPSASSPLPPLINIKKIDWWNNYGLSYPISNPRNAPQKVACHSNGELRNDFARLKHITVHCDVVAEDLGENLPGLLPPTRS